MQALDLAWKRAGGANGFGKFAKRCHRCGAIFKFAKNHPDPVLAGQTGSIDAQLCGIDDRARAGQKCFNFSGAVGLGSQ